MGKFLLGQLYINEHFETIPTLSHIIEEIMHPESCKILMTLFSVLLFNTYITLALDVLNRFVRGTHFDIICEI